MVDDLQRACASRGCKTPFQFQRMVRVISPRATKSSTELLVSRLDGVGLDVTGVPWTVPTPDKLLLLEAVLPTFVGSLHNSTTAGGTRPGSRLPAGGGEASGGWDMERGSIECGTGPVADVAVPTESVRNRKRV